MVVVSLGISSSVEEVSKKEVLGVGVSMVEVVIIEEFRWSRLNYVKERDGKKMLVVSFMLEKR